MSTDIIEMKSEWILGRPLRVAELFAGRMRKYHIRELYPDEDHLDHSHENRRCLTNDYEWLCVHSDDRGMVISLGLYWGPTPVNILHCIEKEFEIEIYPDDSYQYDGFECQEEFDAYRQQKDQQYDDEFYGKLIRFVLNQGDCFRRDTIEELFRSGTYQEIRANLAKQLVRETPEFILPEYRERLITAIENTLIRAKRDHTARKAKEGRIEMALLE